MTQRSPARGSITPFGYRRITCKDRKQRFEHVIVWESHHGPIPEGMELHHRNGDKLDNRLENLMLVTRLEHKRIHSGCIRVGSRWLKRCRRCQWYRPVDTEFYEYKGRNGVMGACRRCLSDLAVIAKRNRKLRAKQHSSNQ
ncbi:HNH endonuclease signature motif containing protein [Pirellulaceae bacterium SH449]